MTKIPKKRTWGSVSYMPLSEIVKQAEKLIDPVNGPKDLSDFSFELEVGYYDETSCVMNYQSIETDIEYKKRLADEKAQKIRREQLERQQYETLKKKYGK